jgi:hypothetical protein
MANAAALADFLPDADDFKRLLISVQCGSAIFANRFGRRRPNAAPHGPARSTPGSGAAATTGRSRVLAKVPKIDYLHR